MFGQLSSVVVAVVTLISVIAPAHAQCNGAGHSLCCNSVNVITHPNNHALFDFGIDFSFDTIAAAGCTGGGNTCNSQATCCQGVVQGFGVACNNFA